MAGYERMTDPARENVTLHIQHVEIAAHVWQGTRGWNASALIGSREQRVIGAVDRADALDRLRESILDSTEVVYALGIKASRRWSTNPHWKGS